MLIRFIAPDVRTDTRSVIGLLRMRYVDRADVIVKESATYPRGLIIDLIRLTFR